MDLKLISFVYAISALGLLSSCGGFPGKNSEKMEPEFDGKYLVDDVFFPQDTLKLKKFRPLDSTTTKRLMIEFRNDSIFLSDHNFSDWDGKWFCNFYSASAKFENNQLSIDAELLDNYRCLNEGAWQKIEYQLTKVSGDSITLIKTRDTSNCTPKWTVHKHLGR